MKKIKNILFILLILFSFILTSCINKNENNIINDIDYTNSKISYLGPTGTYSEEACENYFKNKGTYIPYNTVSLAVDALINDDVNYALIPFENTIGGLTDYVDIILNNDKLKIVGEINLTINQNLLKLKETKLEDIKIIYSHKQGIAQSKEFLNKNLPNAEIIEVSSTAEGAKLVSLKKDKSIAAIASTGAAKVYDLKILEKNIQQNDFNKTKFYVVSKEINNNYNNRLAFIAKGKTEYLSSLISNINSKGKKINIIHDRPLKTTLGEYYYFIELENYNNEEYEKIIKNNSFEFRYLGSFNIIES